MDIIVKQISSLEKIRTEVELKKTAEIKKSKVIPGEKFSYQISVYSNSSEYFSVKADTQIAEYLKIYSVKDAIMDLPCYPNCTDNDFITKDQGIMPDILIPIEKQNNMIKVLNGVSSVWIEAEIPLNFPEGEYDIDISFVSRGIQNNNEKISFSQTMTLSVINENLLKPELIFTQWFHVDCIAVAHNVPIYSEEHWKLIDKYMKLAADLGINMILTPVITPPLDTNIGHERPCTQLVGIEKKDNMYYFDFELLKRWIDLCKKNGIEKFEISHLFSQWGLKYTPNIYALENGEYVHIFGWHVMADDKSYEIFLGQFLPKLKSFLENEGVLDNCYFHISDEPDEEHLEAYRYACSVIKPHLEGCKFIDALSNIKFYDYGLSDIPIPGINCLPEFIEKGVKQRWGYYCSGLDRKITNRYLAMPSYRTRIIGLQMYKYQMDGFLHWGYNFYFSEKSLYTVNPYVTTSADKSFPSGDAFSVYPGKDGPYPSVRAIVFRDALQDVCICRLLEKYIGRDRVIEMIDTYAGMELTIFEYPRNTEFITGLMEKMKKTIAEYAGE